MPAQSDVGHFASRHRCRFRDGVRPGLVELRPRRRPRGRTKFGSAASRTTHAPTRSAKGQAERWERYRSNLAAASAELHLQKSATARRALDAAPEEHRNWEWRHFHSQLDGAGRVLPIPNWGRDFEGLPTFAVSPDDRQLATAGTSYAVSLWDATSTSDQPVHILPGHTLQVWHMTYSPDGRQLATASPDSIRLWDPATGRPLFVLAADEKATLAFSADGRRLLAIAEQGKYSLWDTTTGQTRGHRREGAVRPAVRGRSLQPGRPARRGRRGQRGPTLRLGHRPPTLRPRAARVAHRHHRF